MKVSVITVVYNNVDTIAQSLDSVLAQTWSDVELIVIDGGSTDGTLAVLEGYQARLGLLLSEPDAGIYDALNKGVSLATGDVLGILHADDFLAGSSVIEDIVNALVQTGADGIYGDLQYVRKADPGQTLRYWRSKPYSCALLRQGWMPPHPALYLKRYVYEQVGSYDTGYKIASDYDFMLRVLKSDRWKLSYLPKVFVLMRAGGESNRSLANVLLKSREDLAIIRRHQLGGWATLIRKNLGKIPQFFHGNDKK